MTKKWWMAGAAFAFGATMLVFGGFSAMANTSGYEAYKSALNNTKAQSSLTAKAELTVTDNGTNVMTGKADIRLNQERKAGSVSAAFGDGTQTRSFNVFRQDGKVIFKSSDSDVYRVMEHHDPKPAGQGVLPNPPKVVEQALDILAGPMRELATVENGSDGGKHTALHLSGSQIPAAVNAIGSLIAAHATNGDSGGSWGQMKGNLPKLTDHIQLDKINLDADISPDNVLEQQTAEFEISGTDDSGQHHALVVRIHIDFTGVNETVPERIDLTGQQTQEIQKDWTKHGWHH